MSQSFHPYWNSRLIWNDQDFPGSLRLILSAVLVLMHVGLFLLLVVVLLATPMVAGWWLVLVPVSAFLCAGVAHMLLVCVWSARVMNPLEKAMQNLDCLPPEVRAAREKIVEDILAERKRQGGLLLPGTDKTFAQADKDWSMNDWVAFMVTYLGRATTAKRNSGADCNPRDMLVKVAALAIAAIEEGLDD